MDIYSSLSLKVVPSKAEPDVWIRRLVIYGQITPEPVEVREIKLTKGVNIVWAEESDNEKVPAEITGHSAGKTSFCRLLRYVLGEKTYGTKANMVLIQKAFPGGYVGAELFVHQRQWAVIRPIGDGRYSYLKADATVEELLQDKSLWANEDDYPIKLGLDALLDNLATGAVLRTNKSIQWGQLLAWCTRDQETRFQNCHDWRSPRSDSEWPTFRSSKSDPLFVMRTVLGLFLPDELKGEEQLASLMQLEEQLEKNLPLLKQEPQFRVNLYSGELRQRIRELLPETTDVESLPFRNDDLFAPDLERLAGIAAEKIRGEVAQQDGERNQLEEQLESIGSRLAVLEDRQIKLNTLFSVDSAVMCEAKDGVAQVQRQKELLDQHGDSTCLLGGVLYRECSIVQARQQRLQLSAFQDARALQIATVEKAETEKVLNQQKKHLSDEIVALQKQRGELRGKRDTDQTLIQDKRDVLRDLVNSLRRLSEWSTKHEKPVEFKDVEECQRQLKETGDKIAKLKTSLNDLLAQHDSSRKLISSIFSAAVRGVLAAGKYDGEVSFENRELNFRITRGTAMSGEAVETLSVLLADLSCLVYNSVSEQARLPGFLLHDSPREADLSLRLYHYFMSLAASLQRHFGKDTACPFQYIITTTTPPPEELKSNAWVKLHLNAAVPNESLFRRNIAEEIDGLMQNAEPSEEAENE